MRRRIDPRGPVLGLARTLLATATLITLVANVPGVLFHPAVGLDPPICDGVASASLFCLAPSLDVGRWVAVVLLAVVASGYRPRLTALAHWWVAWSLANSASVLDGGDQAASVLSLLLVPVCLTDARRWHWSRPDLQKPSAVASAGHLIIGIQVAGIYLHAGLAKLGVEAWQDGSAIYYWSRNVMFGEPTLFDGATATLFRYGWVVAAITWGTVALELALGVALLLGERARSRLFVAGLVFHLGIWIAIGIPSFSLVMVAALTLYLRNPSVPLFFEQWAETLSLRNVVPPPLARPAVTEAS